MYIPILSFRLFELTEDSTEGTSNPRCYSVAEMKNAYNKPTVRELDRNAAAALITPMADHGNHIKSMHAASATEVFHYRRRTLLFGAILCFFVSSPFLYLLIR